MNDIALTVEQGDGLMERDDTFSRRGILGRGNCGLIGGVIQEDVIDSRKQSASDGNSGFLGTASLFEEWVLGEDFRMVFGTRIACGNRALQEKWLNILTGSANTGCLLLAGTFIVLGR